MLTWLLCAPPYSSRVSRGLLAFPRRFTKFPEGEIPNLFAILFVHPLPDSCSDYWLSLLFCRCTVWTSSLSNFYACIVLKWRFGPVMNCFPWSWTSSWLPASFSSSQGVAILKSCGSLCLSLRWEVRRFYFFPRLWPRRLLLKARLAVLFGRKGFIVVLPLKFS